ncbi:helix-turn-helix domain-containing protein [Amycolatopsis sp. NBC_01480]|uniref:helix-turn-helix domain-containing protein n=1 Tax=Amycolatopsis sp. NBC_01480 TaxID=2903562 RepID=UPI002E2B44CF|nr:hypothetical protein [Amycolatopsis sp. NBC_01480]
MTEPALHHTATSDPPIAGGLEIDHDIITELVQRYSDGETMESLAEQYPLSYRKVRELLHRAGVTIRPQKILLPQTPPGLVNAYHHGGTIQQLADTHGMSYNQTRRILLAEGVRLRRRGPR